MLVTPLQLATATNVYAAKGQWQRAKLVQYVNNELLLEEEKPADVQIRNPQDWDKMNRAMEGVIKHYLGTAKGLQRDLKYTIAGKTGTAQIVGIKQNELYDSKALQERQRDHALFMTFAPVEDPQISVAVVVENGESAGGTAAPIARKVMDMYLNTPVTEGLTYGR